MRSMLFWLLGRPLPARITQTQLLTARSGGRARVPYYDGGKVSPELGRLRMGAPLRFGLYGARSKIARTPSAHNSH